MRLLFIIVMCAGSFTLRAADTNPPVVKVDDKHQMMNYGVDRKPEIYRVRPSASMVLEAAGYTFDVPPAIRDKPLNSVQVIQSKTHKFELKWQPGTTRYELSKTTLRPLPGSKAFEEFKAGDRIVIAIGVSSRTSEFAPVWASIV